MKRIKISKITENLLMTKKKMTKLSDDQIIEFALLSMNRLPTEQEKKRIKKKKGYFYYT